MIEFQQLNLPAYNFRIRTDGDKKEIFDIVRKIYVALTPEEWVRQHFLNYLISDRMMPAGLIAVEKQIFVNRLSRRCDIVVYDTSGKPQMIVECKSPNVKINQQVFDQAIHYNISLNIKYLLLTNGISHFCFKLDYEHGNAIQLDHIPAFSEL